MLIGVFDSGKGGRFVARRLEELLPEHDYLVVDDHEHVPYGDRPDEDVLLLTEQALQPLLEKVKLIVIACNTSTAIAINSLREKYPDHTFIGYEPMVKPLCALTGHGIILATHATLNSMRYKNLKEKYGHEVHIIEPDTTDWALYIENDTPELIDLSQVDQAVDDGASVIVLACTHYLDLEQMLIDRYPDTEIIEPTDAVTRQIILFSQEVL